MIDCLALSDFRFEISVQIFCKHVNHSVGHYESVYIYRYNKQPMLPKPYSRFSNIYMRMPSVWGSRIYFPPLFAVLAPGRI